jgi:beta-phosphoglucomutase-like phosphatase (HAD superfamily)
VIASQYSLFDASLRLWEHAGEKISAKTPAFLFDLDGTLIDSVYQHVLAWREALLRGGIELAVWRIHRRIGMSGGLFVNAPLRETGRPVTPEQAGKFQKFHSEAYLKQFQQVQPLPGSRELLKCLTKARVQ